MEKEILVGFENLEGSFESKEDRVREIMERARRERDVIKASWEASR